MQTERCVVAARPVAPLQKPSKSQRRREQRQREEQEREARIAAELAELGDTGEAAGGGLSQSCKFNSVCMLQQNKQTFDINIKKYPFTWREWPE